MPTGYTAKIKDGISFRDFMLTCARAFGATALLRDEPLSPDIPEFQASEYHRNELDKAIAEQARVLSLADEEADGEAQKEYDGEIALYDSIIKKDTALKEKYKAMLEQVRAWVPPTKEHVGLKDFAVEQITGSIEFDCAAEHYEEAKEKLARKTGSEWRADKLKALQRDIDYHTKEHEKELTRTSGRNLWVKALKDSLKTAEQFTFDGFKRDMEELKSVPNPGAKP